MEPRWKKEWSGDSNPMRYIGGTPKVDIFSSYGEVRLAWSDDGPNGWHWPRLLHDGSLNLGSGSELDGAPNEEELEEVHNYLRLFAPWVLEII